jgi:2-dehydropantoate 2-reductase
MRFVIVGPGALGCWMAARLAAAGHAVQLVHRSRDRAKALARTGVTLIDADRRTHLDLPVTVAAEAWPDADLLILATKACDVAAAVADLPVPAAAGVLAIQNGLGSEQALVERFGRHAILIGVWRAAAFRGGEGVVHLVAPRRQSVGRLDGAEVSGPQRASLEAIHAAGVPIEIVADIRPARWEKLLINAAINPVAALLEVPNGRLAELEGARQLMALLAGEMAAVAAALGIPLAVADPGALVCDVCRRTADNINSMLADVRAGRGTEIDFINGAVCREADRAAVPVPTNRTVWRLVTARSQIGRGG